MEKWRIPELDKRIKKEDRQPNVYRKNILHET